MIFFITSPNYHLKRQLQLRRNQIVRERTLDRIPHCQNIWSIIISSKLKMFEHVPLNIFCELPLAKFDEVTFNE